MLCFGFYVYIHARFSSVENGRHTQKLQWGELGDVLNSLGGSNKTVVQWKKSWDDMRYIQISGFTDHFYTAFYDCASMF